MRLSRSIYIFLNYNLLLYWNFDAHGKDRVDVGRLPILPVEQIGVRVYGALFDQGHSEITQVADMIHRKTTLGWDLFCFVF